MHELNRKTKGTGMYLVQSLMFNLLGFPTGKGGRYTWATSTRHSEEGLRLLRVIEDMQSPGEGKGCISFLTDSRMRNSGKKSYCILGRVNKKLVFLNKEKSSN